MRESRSKKLRSWRLKSNRGRGEVKKRWKKNIKELSVDMTKDSNDGGHERPTSCESRTV
jgi:hypothetical protein